MILRYSITRAGNSIRSGVPVADSAKTGVGGSTKLLSPPLGRIKVHVEVGDLVISPCSGNRRVDEFKDRWEWEDQYIDELLSSSE